MIWTTRLRSEGAGGLAVWREGSGPPLMLIHGVGLRAEAWGGVVRLVAGFRTVHAVDMPGHGASSLGGTATLSDFIDRIGTFVQSLDTPVTLAGHSMGAMIALELAGRMPDRITGVAALNAIYRRTPEATRAVQARADELDGVSVPSPDATLARWFGTAPQGADAEAAAACRAWLTGVDPKGYATAYRIFAHQDGPADALLQRLTMPALFQTGPGDLNSIPAMSQAMADRAPQGRADIVPGAGQSVTVAVEVQGSAHMMPMTHADAVARTLLQLSKVT